MSDKHANGRVRWFLASVMRLATDGGVTFTFFRAKPLPFWRRGTRQWLGL